MKDVNRKILMLFVSLFAVAMMTTILIGTVMAAPATKIEGVTATLDLATTSVFKAVDHNILQIRDGVATGTVTINIPGQAPLIGTVYGEFIGTIKLGHPPPGPFLEAESVMMGHPIFTFTGEGTTGTFEGVRHTKMIGFPDPAVSHINTGLDLHGTGDFFGQTLKLSFEGTPPPIAWEGYLLIPK